MKKLGIALTLALVLMPVSASAKEIKYVKQKAGQFCKTIDTKNYTFTPEGTKLTCKKDGLRSRWKK